ncbi:unnamed protein product [Caretta caretta]
MEGMALLGDLETHSMDCITCKIRFRQPWAQQGLTPKQWQDLELLIQRSLSDFILKVNRRAQQQGMGYPFVIQGSLGCELHPNGTSRRFYDAGVNGEDFISFEADAGKWVAQQGDNVAALYARDLLNRDKGAASVIQFLLRTCVNELKSFVQHGKESLERPGRGGGATGLLLNSSGILRSSLAVEPGNRHSYACRVEHSSLGGQSLLIPWEQTRRWGPGLVVGIFLGVVAIAAVAVVLWWSRRRGYQDVGPGESSP